MKKFLSIFLVLSMLFSCFAPIATASEVYATGSASGTFAEAILYNGDCGDNVYWALGEGGTLYIYGNGAMDDYATTSEIPWYSYKTQIKSVEVLDGVTYIGNRAFRDTYATRAKFASSVTATGSSVFNNCSKLTYADLGGNITFLNNYVFYNCDALTAIDLKGVETVGQNTFASCGVLVSVAFYKELTKIDTNAFNGNSKLTDVYYEGTTTEWSNVTIASGNTPVKNATIRGTVSGSCGSTLKWAIKGCNLIISGTGKMKDFANTSEIPWYNYKNVINNVIIEEGVTYIGNRAFRDLNITEVEIPEGVTSTGSSVFNSCLKLKTAKLPTTLKNLANYTFYNCDALEKIELPYVTTIGSQAFATCAVLKEISLSSALVSIADNAFASDAKLTDVYYDGTEAQWSRVSINATGNSPLSSATIHCKSVPDNIVALGDCGPTLNWTLDNTGLLTISGTGKMNDFANTSEIPWYSYKSQIKAILIEEGITYIGNRAFRDLNITEAVIPEGVTSTGSSVFNNCLKLAKVTFPSTLTTIANYTCNNCDALTSVDLSYAKKIGTYAFASCALLKEVKLSKDLVSVDAYAFSSNANLKDVYYNGTESDWANISIAASNDPLKNATIHFGAVEEEEEVITIRQPNTLKYKYGEPLDLTGVVIESSKLGVILEVTGDYTVTGYNPLLTTPQDITISSNGMSATVTIAGFNPFLTGKQTVTITYNHVSITIEIEIIKLVNIEIAALPYKTEYALNEELDPDGLIIKGIYSDGSSEEVTGYSVSSLDSATPGQKLITVTYQRLTQVFSVNVVPAGTYTVTFMSDDQIIAVETYTYGDDISVPEPSSVPDKTGYTFAGWEDYDLTLGGDIIVNAIWTPNQYTLTFDTRSDVVITVTYDDFYPELPEAVAVAGKEFVGWYIGTTQIKEGNKVQITEDTKLYPVYTYIPVYTVTFDSQGGIPVILSVGVIEGQRVPVPEEPTKAGYTFVGWYEDPDCSTPFDFNTPIETETTVYAKWELKDYEVTFVANGEIIATEIYNVENLDITVPTVPERPGYSGEWPEYDLGTWLGNLTLDAVYSPITYTVTFMVDGEIIATEEYTIEDTDIDIPEVPEKTGHSGSWTEFNLSDLTDITVTAVYSPLPRTVTFVNWDGTILEIVNTHYGASVEYSGVEPVRPDDDQYTYTFSGWDTVLSYITEDITVKAQYTATLRQFTVTFVDQDGNILKTQVVEYGSSAEAPEAPVVEGYIFLGWNGDYTYITHDITIVATYEYAPVLPEIKLGSATAQEGNIINIDVAIDNNPGIASMLFNVNFDRNVLKLVSVTDHGILGNAVHSDNYDTDSYVLSWANDTAFENIYVNGTVATLSFEIVEGAPCGTSPITVTYNNANFDIFDVDLNTIDFEVSDGEVTVIDHIIGDVNGDGDVNPLDRVVLSRHLATWLGYEEINSRGADVNLDGKVNTLDRAILSRYLANWADYESLPYTR